MEQNYSGRSKKFSNIVGALAGAAVLVSGASASNIWRNYHRPTHQVETCIMDDPLSLYGRTVPIKFDDSFEYTMDGAALLGGIAAADAIRRLRRNR